MLHGGNIYGFSEAERKVLIDFSANITPLGMPDEIREVIQDELEHALHYPDPDSDRLRCAIGEKYHIDHRQVICGNGAADIVYRFVYAAKPKTALVIHPTFVEYEEAMDCVGTTIKSYPLNHHDFKIKEDFLDYVTPELDAIFICNPNNPTGVLTDPGLLLDILKKAQEMDTYVVLDECFLDFEKEEDKYSMIHHLSDFSKLLILKSFTKMYGIPGVRAGYGLSSDIDLLKMMRHCGQSWPVSTMAVSAAVKALTLEDYHQAVIRYVDQERAYLETALGNLGIVYIQGHANYILIHTEGMLDLYEQLLAKHIMIRTCTNYTNLDGSYYRIAINRHEDNEKLIEALSEIFGADA